MLSRISIRRCRMGEMAKLGRVVWGGPEFEGISIRVAVWAAWGAFATCVNAADWPQFLGPLRDGKSAETGLVSTLPTEIAADWTRQIGSGHAGPVVVDGSLLVFHHEKGQEVLEKRSADNFGIEWRIGYDCDYDGGMFRELGPRATPTVAEGAAVSLGSDGVLQAVDFKSGKLQWRKKLRGEFSIPDSFFGVAGSPLVADGLVYVNVGAKDAGCAAFRLSDGALAWKETADGASYASPVLTEVAEQRTVLFLARSGLHALDAKTGKPLFFHRFRARMDASVNAATPIVADGGAFLTASYSTGALWLDLAGGKPQVRWKSQEALGCHYNTPVYHDGFLYGIDGRQEGGAARLQCVDAKTGAVRWTKENFGCTTLTFVEGKFLAVRENGELAMFAGTPTEFRSLGAAKVLSGTARAHPALANGRLYVRDERTLVRLDLRDK